MKERNSIWHLAISLLLAAAALLAATGCEREPPAVVSLEKRTVLPPPPPSSEPVLTVTIGAMITPKEAYAYYRRLVEHIGEKAGMRPRVIDRGSYREIHELLRSGGVDAAFICSGPYVVGKEDLGLEILAVPVVNGKPLYYSYLIVPADSPARSYADLRGKTFALTDPDSNTGALVPTYYLARMGETPDSYFSNHIFTFAHDRSIKAVAEKIVDGAAVDSLIWDFLSRTDPALTSRTRVVHRSTPFGIPPVVAGPGISEELRAKIRRILLDLHLHEEGREILEGMMIDRFASGDDVSYDSIREMRLYLARADGTEVR